MIFNLMLLVYSIRYLLEIYPHVFELQYEEILTNTNQMQQRIIQHYANSFLKTLNLPKHENGKDYTLSYEITAFNIDKEWEAKTNELIDKISQEESHIIPVSQKEFVKTVLGKLDEDDSIQHHPDFKFSNKKILDVNSLIKKPNNRKVKSGLVDPDNTVDPVLSEDLILTKYLEYEVLEDGSITKTFQYIQKYANDITIVNFIKDLPKEIINLFPVITKDILVPEKLPKSLNTTYDYYRVVVDNLPHPENIRYTTILFIIFQIIVPYYYKFHNETIFNDCLI